MTRAIFEIEVTLSNLIALSQPSSMVVVASCSEAALLPAVLGAHHTK